MEKEYYSMPGISNSSMSLINPDQGGTPKKYKKYIIDKEKEEGNSPSLKNGKLIHLYVEDPGSFVIADLDKPSDMMSSWVEEIKALLDLKEEDITSDNDMLMHVVLETQKDRYKTTKDPVKLWEKFCKDGFDYLKFLVKGEDKIVINSSTKEIIENAIEGIKSNPLAKELLFEVGPDFGDTGFSELPIYWSDGQDESVLECKALLDRIRVFPNSKKVQLIDFKTTSKPGTLFKDSFRKFRYYRQLAYYTNALLYFLKTTYSEIPSDEWNIEHYIVSVETYGTFECHVHDIDVLWLIEGKQEYENLLNRLAYHYKHNQWETSIEELFQKGKLELKYDEHT